MDSTMVTSITTALDGFATSLLGNFVQLLPALATICAVGFVIAIIRRKVKA